MRRQRGGRAGFVPRKKERKEEGSIGGKHPPCGKKPHGDSQSHKEGFLDSAQAPHLPERRGLRSVDCHEHPTAARKGLPVAKVVLRLFLGLFKFRVVLK